MFFLRVEKLLDVLFECTGSRRKEEEEEPRSGHLANWLFLSPPEGGLDLVTNRKGSI